MATSLVAASPCTRAVAAVEPETTRTARLPRCEAESPLSAMQAPPAALLRWAHAPDLVVLMTVMEYDRAVRTEHRATAEHLTEADADDLVDDLTQSLALLTGDVFQRFGDVTREWPAPGSAVSMMRPGKIIVGRYRGVRDGLDTIGLGGRFGRGGQRISGGWVVLDNEYDRGSELRRLLRAHELGHALGYDHVESRPSIMNARIGSDATTLDRSAAMVAFRPQPRAAIPGRTSIPDDCADR